MRCDDCGVQLRVGMWPFCPDHGKPYKSKGYLAYIDKNISETPVLISNPGDKRKYLKAQWRNDQWTKIVERD